MKHGKHALIRTTDDLRARCNVDPSTRCWVWTGAKSGKNQPRIHAFDHERGEKRTMSGSLAAWNIAFGRAPLPGWLVYRACGNTLCLCPAHLREMPSLAAIEEHQRRAGYRVGTNTAQRMASLAKAREAQGITTTPRDVVLAIRSAGADVTGRALARQFGMLESTVSKIRRGETHRDVAA
jgi:uncharacterized protein with LGFP repeats